MRSQARPFGHVDWRIVAFITLSALGAVVLLWAVVSSLGSERGFGFDARAYWGYPRAECTARAPRWRATASSLLPGVRAPG
ncbi:MAG: hypothetical protein R3C32_05070 [Chloroflexota bacterium]